MDGRAGIDANLVRRLLAAQFPHWADLDVRPVPVDGWDNRTYRLGDDMSVRLPTAQGYVRSVGKESHWLPRLAPRLPVPIPEVLGDGVPGEGYPFPWSVRGWIEGERADRAEIPDRAAFAVRVAAFLRRLGQCDAEGGPLAGEHCWYRGASLTHYDDETRQSLHAVRDLIDADKALHAWETALAARWTGSPVWFHGDIAPGNLLVVDGRLAAVIDFGTSGVGDPACDLVLAWTWLDGGAREAFREAVDRDEAMWARARGWALWKSTLVMAGNLGDAAQVAAERRIVDAVLAEVE
ncbi:aminoglycoside phosphotransferase family protein [Actinokineospora pegani]|uniref:aminoglycoside phosphotransferase family protein n=1 Tax=Actinokineospora pegani TaxID=2654637 RepID=UPI0012EA5811|nr:aminoglycoside phosphotransferase family protein [Actinokineospora pegani]